jgi:hypothetical protein
MKKHILVIAILFALPTFGQATNEQKKPDRDLRLNLNDAGSHYIKANFTAQIWLRYNQSNPGTTVDGFAKNETFDIGLRRVRTQLYGMLTDKVFFYTQFGINNFTAISDRKSPLFFHDALAEYHITKRSLHMGAGLTAWTGFARFSSPSVATIMGYDAPLYQQATNDATDQFLRKLSVYAKGKLGKLDYRVIMSTPMSALQSSAVKPLGVNSDFSLKPANPQFSGYLMYQFLDEESNLTPYTAGTYLGKKSVFNIGAGFQYQQNAMWHNTGIGTDTVYQNMVNFAVDAFYDHPIGTKGAALSAYATFCHLDFGKGYLRNIGVMNPANGMAPGTDNLNGSGNASPMLGTGNVIQGQVGYLLPKSVLGDSNGQLMPYAMIMHATYDRLKQKMMVYDIGLNWFIEEHKTKISIDYQNRPVFKSSDQKVSQRLGMAVMQFQIAI